jgi:hypothetical protein
MLFSLGFGYDKKGQLHYLGLAVVALTDTNYVT